MKAFGPLMGAVISSTQREGGTAKGKGMDVATPLALRPGGPHAASITITLATMSGATATTIDSLRSATLDRCARS